MAKLKDKENYILVFLSSSLLFITILLFFPGRIFAAGANPLERLPTGKTTPDDLGWTYIGSSVGGYKCYDLASYGVEKVRYVMFLNDSNQTEWDVRGADPDGVLVIHAEDPAYNGIGANAVAHVKIGDGGVGKYGCNDDGNLSRVLGAPKRCGGTPGCACALGHDPEPGQYGGESGYVILDVACGTNINPLTCSGPESEDSGRLIVDRPGNDFCVSEVGYGESHRLYTLDYYANAPEVTVNKPENCANEFVFRITARDDEDQGVSKFTLLLNDKRSGPWVVRSDRLGVDLEAGGKNSLGAIVEDYREPSSKESILELKVGNLSTRFDEEDIGVLAEVEDKRGQIGKGDGGTFISGLKPAVEFLNDSREENTITLSWQVSDNRPLATKCNFSCAGDGACNCGAIPCPSMNPETVSISCTLETIGSYNFEYTVENICGSDTDSQGATLGAPWLMTAYGDTYAHQGFGTLVMQDVIDDTMVSSWAKGEPPGSGNQAYFSTYIISKFDQNYPSRTSLLNYLLSPYEDRNVSKVGTPDEVYHFMFALAQSNECFDSGFCSEVLNKDVDVSSMNCEATHVYFVDGDLNFIGSGSFLASPNEACVFVVKGNVTVGSGVERIDSFILLDGQFETEISGTTLVLQGGVITDNSLFKRSLSGFQNNDMPSEIIIYDAKYLDLLREYISQGYTVKIREYSYSSVK
ncbi:hypothetical protein JW766_02865 [Candidatus Dojkabacteria bacterium]|nr:hypothetical protein [Candidatus Dojkabacteria bacterium]